MVRYPPVGGISGVAFLNEVHAREIRTVENFLVPEVIVVLQLGTAQRTTNHGLKDEVAFYLLDDFIQRKQGIAQVIEDAHEEDVIKLTRNLVHVVNRALGKLDIKGERFRNKAGLGQVAIIYIDPEYAASAMLLKLNRVKSGVATHIQNRRAF